MFSSLRGNLQRYSRLFRGLCEWGSDKDTLNLRCENIKSFLIKLLAPDFFIGNTPNPIWKRKRSLIGICLMSKKSLEHCNQGAQRCLSFASGSHLLHPESLFVKSRTNTFKNDLFLVSKLNFTGRIGFFMGFRKWQVQRILLLFTST